MEVIASIEGTDSSDFTVMSIDEMVHSFYKGLEDKYGATKVHVITTLIIVALIAVCVCSCYACCKACCKGKKKTEDDYTRVVELPC